MDKLLHLKGFIYYEHAEYTNILNFHEPNLDYTTIGTEYLLKI